MMPNIIIELQNIKNKAKDEKDIDVSIVNYLIEHIYDKTTVDLSITDLADRCFTSTSTISRFARRMGFNSFAEMKVKYEGIALSCSEIFNDNLENMHFDFANDNAILENYVKTLNESLLDFHSNINLEEIDKLCELIYKTKSVYFYGTQITNSLLQHAQFLFSYMGKIIELKYSDSEQQRISLNSDKDGLAIFFSMDGNFLRESKGTVYNSENAGTICYLITQNPALKLAPLFDCVIQLGTYQYSKNGRYKCHLFLEILVNRYYLKYHHVQ
jgi:Transcriptional regulators